MIEKGFIKHLAELSGLELDEDSLVEISGEMEEVIRLMDQVKEFPDSDISQVRQSAIFYKELRKDLPAEPMYASREFYVARMIGKEGNHED